MSQNRPGDGKRRKRPPRAGSEGHKAKTAAGGNQADRVKERQPAG